MLKKVEPFVTFGYPNLKTVQDLIYKRGFLKINKQRIPITSNAVIETALGNFNKNSLIIISCWKLSVCWRLDPWNLHLWNQLQESKQHFMAFQTQMPQGRIQSQKTRISQWRWLWKQRRNDQRIGQKNALIIFNNSEFYNIKVINCNFM